MQKILFTGSGGVGSQVIWNCLKKKYNLLFGDEFVEKIHPDIPKINRVKLLNCNNKNYYRQLVKFCNNHKINFLVPGIDEELLKIKILEKKFDTTKLFMPNQKFIVNTLDKKLFYDLCKQLDIQTPKTYLLKSNNMKLKKNIVLKPRFGRGSKGIYFLKKELELKRIKSYILGLKDDYIAQDYIEGQEYTVVIYNNPNDNQSFFSPILLSEKKGISIAGKIKFDKKIINFCKMVNSNFKNQLIYNIQLIKTKSGKIEVIEINPRVSTTFCFLILSGYDPFNNNKKSLKLENNLKSIKFRRYYSNYISYV
jgi:carbamoyl-phosphate synthase large subunit